MLNLFKERTPDVKQIRHHLVQCIKEKLQGLDGGEGNYITGINVFFNCADSERHLYESAVYAHMPDKFRNGEIQRMADDYAIRLPSSWKFEIAFTDTFPAQSYPVKGIAAALYISTPKRNLTPKRTSALIKVLSGQAEQETYMVNAADGKINIGRETKVQVQSGFVRLNAIAFVGAGSTGINQSVSRQHAHIEWEASTGSFLAFADAGGLPPNNKTKIRTAAGQLIKMQATEVGHRLEEGDQIILGDSAVLSISYTVTHQ